MSRFSNEHTERAVLAAFLSNDESQKEILWLTNDDFYFKESKQIFEAIQKLTLEKKPIDLSTISDKLASLFGEDEKKLTPLVIQIQNEDSLGAEYHLTDNIEILKNAAQSRTVFKLLTDARKELRETDVDTNVVIESLRQSFRDIIKTKHSWKNMTEVMMDTYTTLERRNKGEEPSMPSGVPDLDKATTGFHKGELTVIGARPAVGKSAFGQFIALNTAKNGYKVGVVSREMTSDQYGTRILLHETGIENSKLRSGKLDPEEWSRVADALGVYSGYDVGFMFTTRYIEDLRMEVQKKVDNHELDMLVVDYLQLLQTKRRFDQEYLRIGYISKALKDMTVDFGISVVALAQVGRSSDGSMPTLAELRGSGDIEQDADNVIFLHRPDSPEDKFVRDEYRSTFSILQEQGKQLIVLGLAKQRQGQTGNVMVCFDPARMDFKAIDGSR